MTELKNESTRIRHDPESGLWLVEVLSPVAGWIVQGEWRHEADAEADLAKLEQAVTTRRRQVTVTVAEEALTYVAYALDQRLRRIDEHLRCKGYLLCECYQEMAPTSSMRDGAYLARKHRTLTREVQLLRDEKSQLRSAYEQLFHPTAAGEASACENE